MAQDAPSSRAQIKRQSVRSRVEPAIPHALSRKSRPKQQQRQAQAQADALVPLNEASSPAQVESIATPSREFSELPGSVSDLNIAASEPSKDVSSPLPEKEETNGVATSEEQTTNGDHSQEGVAESTLQDLAIETPLTETGTQAHETPPAVREATPSFPFSHQSHPSSSATSTSVPPVGSSGMVETHKDRRDTNHLVFGGYRDSADSSPTPPPVVQTPPPPPLLPLQAPMTGRSEPVQGHPSPYTASHVNLGQQTGPSYLPPFIPIPVGVPPPREHHPAAPQHFGHPRPNFIPNARYHPSQGRSDDFAYMPRYPAAPPRPHGYSQNFQDYGRNPYPYDPSSPMPFDYMPAHGPSYDGNMLPISIMGQGSQQLDAEGQFRRTSTQTVQQSQDDIASIASYIYSQFGNREFSDYVIQLSHTRYLFLPATLPAHGIILAKSSKLRSLMRMQNGDHRGPQSYPKFLMVACSDRFLTHEVAFLKAVMRLYGEPLPDADSIARLPCPPMLARREAMRFALSYAAAGHFLQADEIITHALELAAGFLTWETIASALAFALEGGLSPVFTVFEGASEDKASNSSSFDETPAKLDSPTAAPTYGIYSDRMLHQVIKFLAHNCQQDFQLFAGAPQLPDIARLPASAEPSKEPVPQLSPAPSAAAPTPPVAPAAVSAAATQFSQHGQHFRSNSRLSQIRFGDMNAAGAEVESTSPTRTPPPPPAPPADFATTTMSSILLTLPYALLKHLFEATPLSERLGPPHAAEVARALIAEREQRRRRAMASRATTGAAPQNAVEERLWRNVRWVEGVEAVDHGGPLGLRLVRHVGGVETPRSGESQASGEDRT